MILAVICATLAVAKRKPEKNSGLKITLNLFWFELARGSSYRESTIFFCLHLN